jgi:alkylation response protein AidB-like acyl-CoA dehydrogenase
MHAELTPAQHALKDAARVLGSSAVAPSAHARDHDRRWDPALFRRLAEGGLLGAPFAQSIGGGARCAQELMLLQEGFGEGAQDAGICCAWSAHTILAGIPLSTFGTEAQRQRYLAPMCSGERIGGLAVSEAQAGSDPSSIRTRATRHAGRWILNGQKAWVTNAPIGDHFLVAARTEAESGADGVSVFIVERGTPGLSIGAALDMVGLRTAPIGDLVFEGCEVAQENLLGGVGGWREIGPLIARWERTCLLAPWLGIMQATLDRCMRHARQRMQFGRSIDRFQSVRTLLADMKIRGFSARRLAYRAAASLDAAAPHVDRDAAVAKLVLSEHAQTTARDAIQLHGAQGLLADDFLARCLRDSMALTIVAGSGQVLRSIIAGSLLALG